MDVERDHLPREQIAALAAGGLEPAERAGAERHLRACAECRSLEGAYERAFLSIGLGVAGVAPHGDLRARVLRRAHHASFVRRLLRRGRTAIGIARPARGPARPSGGARIAVAFALAGIVMLGAVAALVVPQPAAALAANTVLTTVRDAVEAAGTAVRAVIVTGDPQAPGPSPASGTNAPLRPFLAPTRSPQLRTPGPEQTPRPLATARATRSPEGTRTPEVRTPEPTGSAEVRTPQPSTPRPTATPKTPEPTTTPEPTETPD